MKARVAGTSVDDFYVLARTVLVKDERHYDRYDRVFAAHFEGIEAALGGPDAKALPEEWLRKLAELTLSEEERAKGFVRPVRRTYKHLTCGTTTTMAA